MKILFTAIRPKFWDWFKRNGSGARALGLTREGMNPRAGTLPAGRQHASRTDNSVSIFDPSSGMTFPTNDFGAYYERESALDEQAIFRPELADRSLHVNELYPEKGPYWGVDDGFGWVDEHGSRYTFVAYYVHWFLWHENNTGMIQDLIDSFRDAYLLTGDIRRQLI